MFMGTTVFEITGGPLLVKGMGTKGLVKERINILENNFCENILSILFHNKRPCRPFSDMGVPQGQGLNSNRNNEIPCCTAKNNCSQIYFDHLGFSLLSSYQNKGKPNRK